MVFAKQRALHIHRLDPEKVLFTKTVGHQTFTHTFALVGDVISQNRGGVRNASSSRLRGTRSHRASRRWSRQSIDHGIPCTMATIRSTAAAERPHVRPYARTPATSRRSPNVGCVLLRCCVRWTSLHAFWAKDTFRLHCTTFMFYGLRARTGGESREISVPSRMTVCILYRTSQSFWFPSKLRIYIASFHVPSNQTKNW